MVSQRLLRKAPAAVLPNRSDMVSQRLLRKAGPMVGGGGVFGTLSKPTEGQRRATG